MHQDSMLPVYLAQLQAHLERQLRFVKSARAIVNRRMSDLELETVSKPGLGELIVDVMNTNRLVDELVVHARAAADRAGRGASAPHDKWAVRRLLAQLDDVKVHASRLHESVNTGTKPRAAQPRGAVRQPRTNQSQAES